MTPRQQSTRRLADAQAARLELFYPDPDRHEHTAAQVWQANRNRQPICEGCRQAKREYEADRKHRTKEIQP